MVDVAAILFGLFLGVLLFTVTKAVQQTQSIWKRTHSIYHSYLFLVWGEIVANFVFCLITFLFLNGIIIGRLWFFILIVIVWSIQVEFLPQIIANRVALIMTNKRRAKYLKWGLAAIITPVALTVCYVWTVAQPTPTHTPSDAQVRRNFIFEKTEKTFFLLTDLTLNIYFLYLVRHNLISNGLNKYWKLFHFNVGMVMISTMLDALLLGFLSLKNKYIYVQYAPFAYICKLYIELLNARLISKVAQSSSKDSNNGQFSTSKDKAIGSHGTAHLSISSPNGTRRSDMIVGRFSKIKNATVREGSNGSDIHLATYEGHGITKTIETTFMVVDPEDGDSDRTYNEHDKPFDGTDRSYKQNA